MGDDNDNDNDVPHLEAVTLDKAKQAAAMTMQNLENLADTLPAFILYNKMRAELHWRLYADLKGQGFNDDQALLLVQHIGIQL